MAQIIELMGNFPKKLALSGKYSQDMFNRKGELRHVQKLRMWPLQDVLHEKYLMPRVEAEFLTDFLSKMLALDPVQRATAQDMAQHSWLDVKDEEMEDVSTCPPSGDVQDNDDHRETVQDGSGHQETAQEAQEREPMDATDTEERMSDEGQGDK